MSINELNRIVQTACVTVLALVGLLLTMHAKSGRHSRTGVGFVVAIICYLLIESDLKTEDQRYHERFEEVKSRPKACDLKSQKKESIAIPLYSCV